MKYSSFTAVAIIAVGFSSFAQAQILDRTNSPSDIQIERRAMLGTDSGSAVGTSGSFVLGTQVWDPANDPRDVTEVERANAISGISTANFNFQPSAVWDPAVSYD